MEFGQIVYHVANPTVRGVVVETPANEDQVWIKVFFSEPVRFSGNHFAHKKETWACSRNLLFSSTSEAIENHKPDRA